MKTARAEEWQRKIQKVIAWESAQCDILVDQKRKGLMTSQECAEAVKEIYAEYQRRIDKI